MSPVKKKVLPKKSVKFKVTPKKGSSPKTPKASSLGRAKVPVFDPEVRIFPSTALLFEETAPYVMQVARESVDARGRFILALSGGSTPKGLFQQLCEEPVKSLMPWDRTYVFWGDERHVALTDEKSNYRMAQELLLSKLPIPKANIFPMTDGSRTVEQAASLYEGKLKKFFGMQMPRMDLNLMGMGDDGHTASLFPGVVQLNESHHWVVGYFVDDEKKDRVSLTFPVLNASRVTLVLMEGAKKASRLKDVLEGPKEPPRYPIQYLKPTDGKLVFAMDKTAASLLQK